MATNDINSDHIFDFSSPQDNYLVLRHCCSYKALLSTGIPDSYCGILPGPAQGVSTDANLDSDSIALNLDSTSTFVVFIDWEALR
jgi:hypothetical protein